METACLFDTLTTSMDFYIVGRIAFAATTLSVVKKGLSQSGFHHAGLVTEKMGAAIARSRCHAFPQAHILWHSDLPTPRFVRGTLDVPQFVPSCAQIRLRQLFALFLNVEHAFLSYEQRLCTIEWRG